MFTLACQAGKLLVAYNPGVLLWQGLAVTARDLKVSIRHAEFLFDDRRRISAHEQKEVVTNICLSLHATSRVHNHIHNRAHQRAQEINLRTLRQSVFLDAWTSRAPKQ